MERRVTRVKEPDAATAVTPRHSPWIGAVDPSTLSVLLPATQPAASREVVLPGCRLDCSPLSGRQHPQTMEQRSYELWRHAMTRLMTLLAALLLTMLPIILGAPKELWLAPPF